VNISQLKLRSEKFDDDDDDDVDDDNNNNNSFLREYDMNWQFLTQNLKEDTIVSTQTQLQ
jgi:hypothetical protein